MKGLFFSTGGIHMATLMGMFIGLKNKLNNIDYCGGISAGAFLSSLCALYSHDEIENIIKEHAHDHLLKNRHKYFNTIISSLFNKSILDDSQLKSLLDKLLNNRILLRDLFIGVTNEDTMTYELKHFKKGELYPSLSFIVHASMSIPILLPGVTYENKHLVDGGLFHSIPVEAIDTCIEKAIKEKAETFDITILSSKRFNAVMKPEKNKHLEIPHKAIRMMYSHGYITMHNDHIILDKAISNAKEHGIGITLNFFSIPDDQLQYYDKKIQFQEYGHINKNTVNVLMELGKKIVHHALYKLKF